MMGAFWSELPARPLAYRAAMLALTVVVLVAILLPVGGMLSGWVGLAAVAVAAGVCLLGAEVALVVSHLLRGPQFMLPSLLLGMMVRMGLPLGIALVCLFRGGGLAEAGFVYYLLVFYPITLAAETMLSLPRSSGSV